MTTVLDPTTKATEANPTGMVHFGCIDCPDVALCGARLLDIAAADDEPLDCIVCAELFANAAPCPSCGG